MYRNTQASGHFEGVMSCASSGTFMPAFTTATVSKPPQATLSVDIHSLFKPSQVLVSECRQVQARKTPDAAPRATVDRGLRVRGCAVMVLNCGLQLLSLVQEASKLLRKNSSCVVHG